MITVRTRSTHADRSSRCPTGSEVQTLVFDKKRYTLTSAREWALKHNFVAPKADVTAKHIRLRQKAPGKYTRMRTITLKPGVRAVVGWKKC